jgi:hypothetical protein
MSCLFTPLPIFRNAKLICRIIKPPDTAAVNRPMREQARACIAADATGVGIYEEEMR